MNIFSQLSIRSRLLFFGLVLSAITVGISAKGIMDVISMSAITDKLYKHPFAVSTSTLKIQSEIVSMHRSMKDVALAKNNLEMNKAIALVDAHERHVFQQFSIIEQRFLGDQSRVAAARQLFTNWKEIRDEVISKMRAGDRIGAAAITKNKGAQHVKKMTASIDFLIDFAFNKAADFIANATAKKEQTIRWAIINCSIALLLSMATAFAIINSINSRLQQTNRLLKDISEGDGDLSKRLPESGRDELTELSGNFNRFIEKIQNMIRQVYTEADTVKQSTSTMVNVVQELNNNMVQQNTEVDSVVTAITQVNSSASEVAGSASSTAEAAIASNQETQSGRQTVDQSINVVNNLADNISDSYQVMENLNHQVNNIVSVLDVIRDIAEQTNLLALNAAIEAARAGEMGRGFAVVADEVRSLAGRTQDSTNEIQTMMDSLQSGAQQAMQAMDNSRSHSSQAVNHSQMAGQSLDSITDSICQIEDMNIQIASAIDQITQVTEDISQNATRVADISSQTLNQTQAVETEISQLDRSTHNLHQLVAQFKV